jgi:predicted GNAT superfamily acetyltransferase
MSAPLIRRLATLEDCRKVVELEKKVWGYTDAEDVVPAPVLIVSIKRGGVLLGSFDASGDMTGFVYSMPGWKRGRPTQWSHMLGVVPDARSSGLGRALKLAQREAALAMGIDLVEWTYDPLQALNAHLNFAKLGVVVAEYEENIYGESSSPLHRGSPTDRFVAEWNLREPHVERRISAAGSLMRDASVASAPVVNPSKPGPWLEPTEGELAHTSRRVLVEVPVGFSDMQATEPHLALSWRMTTRRIFETYFSRGYRAVDFFLSREARRGHYLLAQK